LGPPWRAQNGQLVTKLAHLGDAHRSIGEVVHFLHTRVRSGAARKAHPSRGGVAKPKGLSVGMNLGRQPGYRTAVRILALEASLSSRERSGTQVMGMEIVARSASSLPAALVRGAALAFALCLLAREKA
jgi:hypothetical protein